MPDFLLELYSEEIPSRFQIQAAREFRDLLTKTVKSSGMRFGAAEAHATPRRLCVAITGLADESSAQTVSRRGPRVGAPDKAVNGFARSAGVDLQDLEVREEAKGEFYYAVSRLPGKSLREILNKAVPTSILAFRWPKSMRWGTGNFRWVRPLRSILAIIHTDSECIPLTFCAGGVSAGNFTKGNRSLFPDPFQVSSFSDYKNKLFQEKVILSTDERKRVILSQAAALAAEKRLEIKEDDDLLTEVAGLVEWPTAMVDQIESRFQKLPQQILVTAMRTHQKFLAAQHSATGQITHFVVVANREAPDGGKAILNGNRLVMKARLEDAEFVWANDLRRIHAPNGLQQMERALQDISFHHRLGTIGHRAQRMKRLTGLIAQEVGYDQSLAEQTAEFCKLDLTSETVGEFPELQGVIGGYFAKELGLPQELAMACQDHYLPAGPEDRVPADHLTAIVGIADRIDQLSGFFGINEVPTGSRDPFALRRAAIGIIRLVSENRIRLRLKPLLSAACDLHANTAVSAKGVRSQDCREVTLSALEFIHERLAVHLRTHGFRHDIIIASAAMPDADDLVLLIQRAEALGAILETEAGERLLHGYRRANNILNAEFGSVGGSNKTVDQSLLESEAEKHLKSALDAAAETIGAASASEDLQAAMRAIAELSQPIDRFFEQVHVNVEHKALRLNRLALVANVRMLAHSIADFSKIEQ